MTDVSTTCAVVMFRVKVSCITSVDGIILCRRDTTHFHSEHDYRTGCQNVSHCQQQQSHSGLLGSNLSQLLTKLSQTGSFLAWRFNFTPFFLFFPFLSLSFCPVCHYFVTRVKMKSKHNPLDKSNGGSEDEIDSGRPAQCSIYPVNHQQSRFDWDKPVSNVVLLPCRSKLIEKNSTLTRDVWNWIVLLPCSTDCRVARATRQ